MELSKRGFNRKKGHLTRTEKREVVIEMTDPGKADIDLAVAQGTVEDVQDQGKVGDQDVQDQDPGLDHPKKSHRNDCKMLEKMRSREKREVGDREQKVTGKIDMETVVKTETEMQVLDDGHGHPNRAEKIMAADA